MEEHTNTERHHLDTTWEARPTNSGHNEHFILDSCLIIPCFGSIRSIDIFLASQVMPLDV